MATKAQGMKMIIYLQTRAGMVETEEQASRGWDRMLDRERMNTERFYGLLGGPKLNEDGAEVAEETP